MSDPAPAAYGVLPTTERRFDVVRLAVPDESPYPLANLPYGVYSAAGSARRPATRLGDHVIDLGALLGESGPDAVFAEPTLNAFLAQGPERWAQVRERIAAAVTGDVDAAAVHAAEDVALHLPIEVADYVDFYASQQHATNLGRLFRPDAPEPLLPNWKHLPVGYHGRSSTIVVSGTDIARPAGQRKDQGREVPEFGPSQRLDFEAELGFVIGVGNPMGQPIPVADAEQHMFGVTLFNDWSARDIQAWEYVPLGPNLGKSFASTVSPWIVPLAALHDARVRVPPQQPAVLPYLQLDDPWGLDITLEVEINGDVVSRPPYSTTYWSPAQMLAHLTVNGAATRTGDLFASGTVSGPARDEYGSLIELTAGGSEPLVVGGQQRTFLQNGDVVTLRASAGGAGGTRIGFGEARGRIVTGGLNPDRS